MIELLRRLEQAAYAERRAYLAGLARAAAPPPRLLSTTPAPRRPFRPLTRHPATFNASRSMPPFHSRLPYRRARNATYSRPLNALGSLHRSVPEIPRGALRTERPTPHQQGQLPCHGRCNQLCHWARNATHKPDEVPPVRIEQIEGKRIALAACAKTMALTGRDQVTVWSNSRSGVDTDCLYESMA